MDMDTAKRILEQAQAGAQASIAGQARYAAEHAVAAKSAGA